jgi:two-component system phosphate regulon sensor histidine kinase PhoR
VTSTQAKLMAALTGLVVLVVAVSGVLAERGLRERHLARLADSLEERARLVLEQVRDLPFLPAAAAALDERANRAGAAAGARVTLVAADGTVVGDSDVPLERLPELENHARRPEIEQALRGAVGYGPRYSDTVGRRLFYLAIPAGPPGRGAVRLAVDLADLEAAIAELRGRLLLAGLMGLAAALPISYLLAWIALQPIREMRRAVASIAGGDLDARLPLRWRDELGEISSAINRMAEQLRERLEEATGEKEQLQAVLDGMVEGVLVVDAAGKIALANDRLREFYDVWTEVRGRTPLEAIRDQELDEIIAEAAASEEAVFREVSVERRASRILRVQAVRFPSPGRPRMGTVAVFHDVTELARLEQVRQDFVVNASHELRTPLAAIRGFAETLLHGGEVSEPERRSQLEIIDRHARRLTNLVGDLLELSRLERREATFDLGRVDVAGLAEVLIRDSRPRFEEKRLTVTQRVSGSPVAWADAQAVEQILTNLLDNAAKYTPAGGRIELAVEGEAGCVRVRVADTGIGIPRADLGRIFERFYRVDKARSRALGGTGLGLSIVKHLVQRLGGEISVESEPGQGSTFSFTLPRPEEVPAVRSA